MSETLFSMKSTRVLLAAAVIALVSGAAACSSGSNKTSSTTSSSGKTITTLNGTPQTVTTVDGRVVGNPCAFIKNSELPGLFDGASGKVIAKSGAIINGMSCTRSVNAGVVDYALVTSIQQGSATYGEKYVLNAKHLDGLGETAYVAKHSIGGGLIISFVRNGRTYTLNYAKSGTGAATKPDPSDQSEQLLALIRSAVAQLP
jgi:hypothetical protein